MVLAQRDIAVPQRCVGHHGKVECLTKFREFTEVNKKVGPKDYNDSMQNEYAQNSYGHDREGADIAELLRLQFDLRD